MRFETAPGEQAQVDWGSLAYIDKAGKKRRIWVFVMTLGWSRACCVELVRRADTAAFEYLGVVPRRCLYDNAKVITLGRDEEKRPVWNERMLDFPLWVGFELGLCRPYWAQTKGKVESGVKYVRRNMWPSRRFTDDADLNRQGLEWCDTVANRRIPRRHTATPRCRPTSRPPGWKSDVGRRLDDLIVRNVPDVRKAVRWNSPWYGIEGESWFVSYHGFTRYVKVTFLNSASRSPVPPGSGKDKDSRWVDIYEDILDEEQMADWIRQAAALPGSRGF